MGISCGFSNKNCECCIKSYLCQNSMTDCPGLSNKSNWNNSIHNLHHLLLAIWAQISKNKSLRCFRKAGCWKPSCCANAVAISISPSQLQAVAAPKMFSLQLSLIRLLIWQHPKMRRLTTRFPYCGPKCFFFFCILLKLCQQ